MTMREELFVDGPLKGWRAVPAWSRRSGTVEYPRWHDIDVTSFGQPKPQRISAYDNGMYRRRRYVHPSWRIVLAFWLEGITVGPMPYGAAPLPGFDADGSSDYERCLLNLYKSQYGPPDWQALQAAWDELHRAWQRNEAQRQWELTLGSVVFGTVTYEFIARAGMPREHLQAMISREIGVPLPDEAWR